ncbi:MAG: hypothetical protein WBG90_03005 [Saonia sp.]
MKRALRTKGFLLLLVLMAVTSYGQKTEHSPNILYENFSKAYREMDAAIVEQLYLKDAVLLNLYDSASPNSISGKNEIKNFFSDFFKRFKKNGQELRLAFKITDREELKDAILDNGFYELTIISPNRPKVINYGKLSTILKLDNGNWKFLVDANTNTDEIEYKNAKTGSIPQPR